MDNQLYEVFIVLLKAPVPSMASSEGRKGGKGAKAAITWSQKSQSHEFVASFAFVPSSFATRRPVIKMSGD